MKSTAIKLFGALIAAALPAVSAQSAGTDTWVGNTDANWNTAANWTTSGGSTPPANGDSLVFGAAGSAGASLNNNISSLLVNGFNINGGASAFTFGGNAVILKGALTNAASVTETFSAGISIGAGFSAGIRNTGSGTLSLGAVTQVAAPGGTVDFSNTGGGALTTSSANVNGILGGWATTGNEANWAANDGSGNVVTYSGYTSITAATAPSATQNWQANNAASAINASGTINSLNVQQDFTVNAGVTMTLGSGGLILGGTERWLKAGNTTTSIINSGLGTGELYIHANATSYANGFQVQPVVTDGSVASALIKDGPGQVQMQNANNTYSGGTYLNAGTIYLGSSSTGSGASVTKGPLGTGTVTLNGGAINLNAQTLGNNLSIPAGASATIDNRANNATLNGNFTGAGTLTIQNSSGPGLSENVGGDWSGFTGTLNYNGSASANNFNFFAPASMNLSNVTVNFSNSGNRTGSSFRTSGTTKLGSLAGYGYLDVAGTVEIGNLNTSTTFSGIIRNNGSTGNLVKVGTGAFTLSGASQNTGTITVENGSLIAGANIPASGNGPFGNATSALALGDATSEAANQNVALLVGGAFSMARPVTVGAGNATTATFTVGGNSANSATLSGAITLNQSLVVTQATGGTLTVSGGIGENIGGMGVTKVGAGTAVLTGANSYSGLTAVNNGVLLMGNPSQGNGAVTVADGATAGVSATMDTTYWWPTSLTVGSSTGGSLQFNLGGTITAPNGNPLLSPSSLTLNGTTTIIVGSCPQVVGLYPLFNNYSSGALVLGSQPAGVLGQLTVSGGTVYYEVTNFVTAVWTAAVNTNWDLVTANWTNTIGGNKYVAGYPALFDDTAAGASPLLINVVNPVSPNSVTVNNTAKAYVIGGAAIGGATGLTKTGNNTLTLTGTNTFTGDTTISGGTLEIGGAGQLGGGTYSGAIQNDATLDVNSSSAQTLAGAISGGGALIKNNAGTLTLPAANAGFYGTVSNRSGTIQVNASTALGYGTLVLDGGAVVNGGSSDIAMGNNIEVGSGGGSIALGVAKNLDLTGYLSGAGNLTLGGPNPLSSLNLYFTGNALSGTITIPNSTGNNQTVTRFKYTSAGSTTAAWSIGGAQDRGTTLDFGDGTIDFGSLSGSGLIQGNSAGTHTLSVGALGQNSTFSGRLVNNIGVIALTKVGAGTFTLSGANTYTGLTAVNEGTLVTSALSTGAGDFTVADNATFGVAISGGGTLNVASLTLGNNSTNAFINLSSTVNPAINDAGSLTLNGTVAVSVQQAVILPGVYPLITAASIEGGGGLVLGSLPGGVVATLQTNGTTIELNVTTGTPPFVWTGLTDANWDLATANNWASNSVSVVYTNDQLVQFDDTSTQTNVTVGTNIAPGLVLVTNSTRSYTFSGGAITGSGSLTKTGNGRFTLANTNTYTGGTLINNGSLQLGDGVANNGVVAGGITDNANLIIANPIDQTLANVVSGSGNLAKTGAGVLTVSGANTFAGTTTIKQGAVNVSAANNLSTNAVVLGDTATGADAALQLTAAIGVGNSLTVAPGAGARKLANNSGTTATYYGAIALSNNLTVVKNGGQDLNLEGVFTGSGNVIVSNTANIVWFKTASPDWTGSLILQAGSARPGTAAMQMNTNTVLSINTGAFFNVGGANYDLDFAGVNDIPGATGGGFGGGSAVRSVVLNGSGNYIYSGVYDSASWGLRLNMGPSGKQTLTGNNTYRGDTTINAGTLALSGSGSISNTPNINIGNGATFDVAGLSSTFSLTSAQTLRNSSGMGNVVGNVNLDAGSLVLNYTNGTPSLNVASGTLSFNANPTTVTVAGPVLSGGSYKLIAKGAGGSVAGTLPVSYTINGTGAPVGATLQITSGELFLVVPATEVQLTNSFSGGVLSLSWPAGQGWTLEGQTNSLSTGLSPTGWGTVTDAGDGSYSVTIDPAQPTVFYRLVKP